MAVAAAAAAVWRATGPEVWGWRVEAGPALAGRGGSGGGAALACGPAAAADTSTVGGGGGMAER